MGVKEAIVVGSLCSFFCWKLVATVSAFLTVGFCRWEKPAVNHRRIDRGYPLGFEGVAMIYEIVVPPGTEIPPDLDLLSDNPHAVRDALLALRQLLGDIELTVLRDDLRINIDQLAADEESYDIQATMDEDTQLPPTFRAGRTGESDLGRGVDGERHGVWKPRNPEDDYD